jgi:long-chain acyl-CoA synthetase
LDPTGVPRLRYNPAIAADNFNDLFVAAATRFPERIATELQRRDGVDRLTYGELCGIAERTAGWLAAEGLRGGDRVALLAENDGLWCGVYLGILRLGAVAVPLDTAYTPAQIATVLADSGAAAIFTSVRHLVAVRQGVGALPGPPGEGPVEAGAAGAPCRRRFQIILLDGGPDGEAIPFTTVRGPETRIPPAFVTAEDPAVILYTSGTTSDPKGVVLTHGNLVAERSAAFQVVKVDDRDVVLGVLPLFHALAQMANLLLPLSVGARVVFLETINTTELTRALRERGITAFVCVPQFFYLLHQRIEHELAALPMVVRAAVRALAAANLHGRRWTGVNVGRVLFRRIHRSLGPDLRLLVTGGARFDPAVNRALYALGFTIRQAYGLTECSGAATVSTDGDWHFASVGRPMPGVEVRVAADGEVLIRGPIVMRGYFNRPDQNETTLRDGWLHTGDLGSMDAEGRLTITGRSKEVIVLGSGKNIYPEEVEAHYERSPFIQELCIAGVSRPGEPSSERLHALLRPDAEAMQSRGMVNIRELLRFEIESLSVQLPAHKRILGYDITLEPLPRTSTRKLKRFEIEKMLRERAAAAERAEVQGHDGSVAAWPDDPRVARIVGLAREVIGSDAALSPSAHLELDLGLDSMERVELLVHLTAALSVELPEGEAQTLHTLGDVVEAMRSRLGVVGADSTERVDAWERMLGQAPADAGWLEELARPKVIRAAVLFGMVKLLHAAFWLTMGLRARGRQQLPASGPYLISPNHQSYLDAFLLVGALPFRAFRRLFFVGAAEYFQSPVTRWLARVVNVVPIDPDANLVAAMQAGAHGLRLGKVLVLFPEGERSIDGRLKTFRKGAAILSYHAQAPIVPVAIDGAWDVWARGRPLNWAALLPWRRTRVRLRVGSALPPPSEPDYAAHTGAVRQRVHLLWEGLHAERRGGR